MGLIAFSYYLCLLSVVDLVNVFEAGVTGLVCWAELNRYFLVYSYMSIEELIWFVGTKDHDSVFKILLL